MARESTGWVTDIARYWRLFVALGAVIALVVMTADILIEGSLRTFDGTVSEIFDTRAGLSLHTGLVALAFISEDVYAVGLVVAVLAVATIAARSLRPALTVVGTMAANWVVIEVMKTAFGRTAPDTGEDLFGVNALSYPSGHSANTIIIWTLLLRIIFGLWGDKISFLSTPLRRFLVVASLAVVFGGSLVGLNYHWLTDIVAGWLIGIALSMLAPSPLPEHLRPENRHLREAAQRTSASTNPARAFGTNHVLLRGIFSRDRLTATKSSTETGATRTAATASPASTSAASHDGP
ncbi:phosphatase PAP2 family protein [Fodinicola feengrottensis]|uniref:phosphatase PAP2 family protein n=1 Tax=Fodinicola feengrottensis TaxID=435914 RepID=UPI0031D74FC0